MARGNIVETAMKPSFDSVQEYKKYLKVNAPIGTDWVEVWDPDITCTCCGQEAPAEAAAMLKVEDETPVNEKFKHLQTTPTGTQGRTVWICADCYNNGVRPKHVYFGNIKWNKMGRRVKKRAESGRGHPW